MLVKFAIAVFLIVVSARYCSLYALYQVSNCRLHSQKTQQIHLQIPKKGKIPSQSKKYQQHFLYEKRTSRGGARRGLFKGQTCPTLFFGNPPVKRYCMICDHNLTTTHTYKPQLTGSMKKSHLRYSCSFFLSQFCEESAIRCVKQYKNDMHK